MEALQMQQNLHRTRPVPLKPGRVTPDSTAHSPEKFRVRLEICAPDSFSVTPVALLGFLYPGGEECLRRLVHWLSDVMPSHYTQNNGGGKACVYKLRDYSSVLTCLKNSDGIEVEGIPWVTFNVIEKLSHSFITGRWNPCRPEHLSDDIVDEMIGKLPKRLLDVILPFQLEGVKFGLRRGGRCLIADEMGLGKTLQAVAIAACFMKEGSILVVCPAILRLSWAEELERWLPFCLPADIHLVFGHRNNPVHLTRFPRVVVISYTMLHRLRKSMIEQDWALLIVDESHHVRCSKRTSEPEEVKAVLDVAAKVKHMVLLSGTPSLSRPYDIFHQINMLWPGLLGKTKYDFAKTYCDVKTVRGYQGKHFQDFSKGVRLEELNVLLKQTVMIRRLKQHVLVQLPPKRRQIIRLLLKRSDIVLAKAAVVEMGFEKNTSKDMTREDLVEPDDSGACHGLEKLSYQELGIAKLSGFREWFSIHPIIAESDGAADLDLNASSPKMIIFAHHHKVLDGVQEFVSEKGIGFVRIDGTTLPRDRQSAVHSFQALNEVKIAIIGITAGGVGLDFSSAQNVVFLELPQSPSLMLQAEDRAHRRGQTSAVNIYIFCAKDTRDESHWQNLNKSLRCVSSATDGKYDALLEIAVEGVSYVEMSSKTDRGCEDQTLDQVSSHELFQELRKLPKADVAQDIRLINTNDKITANMNDKLLEQSKTNHSSAETDDLHIKTDTVPDLDNDEGYVSMDKLEEITLSGAENAIPGKLSSYALDDGQKDKDEPEKENKSHFQTTDKDNVELLLPIEADECTSDQVNSLRFEVSQYTGRIHLYSCIPGNDSRPRPLFQSFRPEELDNKERISQYLKENPAYRHAILAFISDWNMLRPIEQTKLLGKPLQLPLSVELCYLKETINPRQRAQCHEWFGNNSASVLQGLLKGGSKRRTTPSYEISHPLPSNAVWKKVIICSGSRKKEKEYTQGWTLNNEPLCKLCQTPCKGNNAKTPEYFEDLFCNLDCYEEYRLRTSGGFLREEIFRIEHGVCTNCQLDCHKLVKHIKPLSLEQRQKHIEKVAPKVASRKNLLEKLVNDPTEGNAWHADHIVPVYRGGGECRLENMRTLCVACHYDVTTAQCAERRSTRAKARKQLKVIMDGLRNNQNSDKTICLTKDQGHAEMEENIAEDKLLVDVPGSSYSGGGITKSAGSEDLNSSKAR
ncbi:DNA annealing helicase and endonuclease ZRANB3 [Melia azedarach]|uniref:DNA annealing helicase and endonuclease ZRANB3 n=1 Tax=Melia azedarach TaxID=155640 RepID=A0ACC1XNR3_MELAZ|nr:DNA annealing helicase and endonuclease ZRANB3 [Melia azedarach]